MHPVLDYLLKANLLLAFFGVFYLIFLKRETFYQLNRWYFIGSIVVSITAPLITFTKTVFVEPIIVENYVNAKQTAFSNNPVKEASVFEGVDLQNTAVFLIVLISIILIIKRIYAVIKLYQSIKKMPSIDGSNIKFTDNNKTVYSFYRWIVVPENFFQWQNHQMIIDHENIHLKQKHTFDLIFIELVAAVFWFNPLLKIIQCAINTNLEFIVDQKMIEKTESISYQKNLLQFQTQNTIQFVNSYNASEIKNRILQINSKKSTQMKKLKFLLATPVLIAFFIMFQIETVAQVKESNDLKTHKSEKPNTFKNSSIQTTPNATETNLSDKEKDFSMLHDTVNKDLNVLKNDRKTFDKIASKYPIVIDGVLMTKNDLKKFDTTTIQSVHIDSGNPENGTILKLSTKVDENSDTRMFTFKIADIDNEYFNATEDKNKPTIIGSEKLYDKIIINGKEATEEEWQKFYRTSSYFTAKNENRVIIVESYTPQHNNTNTKESVIGNNVVYIVDGDIVIKDDFRKIHPNDIEKIDVLKDSKVIEKYGDKAKDGVIVVTTKKNKETTLLHKQEALKARELALKERKQVVNNQKEVLEKRKIEIEKRRALREAERKELLKRKQNINKVVTVTNKSKNIEQLKNDYKIVDDGFNNIKKLKELENDKLKITELKVSLSRPNGNKIEMSETY